MTTQTRAKILEYIKTHGQARPVELVGAFGFTKAAIHRQLNKLLAQNLIERVGAPPKVFYLALDMNFEKELKRALKKNKNILSAYTLGSVNNFESDFDLAIVTKHLSEDDVYNLVKHIKFPRDLDLSVVNKQSSPLFLFQIVSTGKRIYEKNLDDTLAFEDFVLCNYYDTANLRRQNYQSLKQNFLYAD